MDASPSLPRSAVIAERLRETDTIFTLRLRLEDGATFPFRPGQFNMVGIFGVGEIPLSIVSDPTETDFFDHTVRIVGRITEAMSRKRAGDRLTVRGPFGKGWPLEDLRGRDLILLSGGVGCAPLVSVVNYIVRRRNAFGELTVLHGVKTPADLIWKDRFASLEGLPRTRVYLSSDVGDQDWNGWVGNVTELIPRVPVSPTTSVHMCGPEPMMIGAVQKLVRAGIPEEDLWVSLERNMQCAAGYCGHCQLAERFICRDGPVFRYSDVKPLLGQPGL